MVSPKKKTVSHLGTGKQHVLWHCAKT